MARPRGGHPAAACRRPRLHGRLVRRAGAGMQAPALVPFNPWSGQRQRTGEAGSATAARSLVWRSE